MLVLFLALLLARCGATVCMPDGCAVASVCQCARFFMQCDISTNPLGTCRFTTEGIVVLVCALFLGLALLVLLVCLLYCCRKLFCCCCKSGKKAQEASHNYTTINHHHPAPSPLHERL